MKKHRVLTTVIIVALIGTAAVSVLALTYRNNRRNRALPVETYTVAPQAMEETVSGTGTFVPDVSSTVHARVSGTASRVEVSAGDPVEAGALLVELEREDYIRAVQQAESAYASARRQVLQSLATLRAGYRNAVTAHQQAERTYQRNLELFRIDALAEEALEQSQDALESAAVNLESAREQLNLRLGIASSADPAAAGLTDSQVVDSAPEVVQAAVALETARANLARTRITAPHAGTVTQITPSAGDFVAPNAPVAKVERLDRMLARVQIDEVDIGKISEGQNAEITSDSILGRTLSGTVSEISPVVSQVGSTRVSAVEIAIEGEEDARLKSGASCTARITTRTRDDAIAIPLSAFITLDNIPYVYALIPDGTEAGTSLGAGGADAGAGPDGDAEPENGAGTADGEPADDGERLFTLERRRIETGISTIDLVEVTSGLSEGDVIVQGGLDVLRDGMRVTARSGQ